MPNIINKIFFGALTTALLGLGLQVAAQANYNPLGRSYKIEVKDGLVEVDLVALVVLAVMADLVDVPVDLADAVFKVN